MGRRKRDDNTLNQFCYYCDKEYDHKDTLLEHQKDRHFACTKCRKKFSTAGSMATHMLSVHRETLGKVPNAKVGRDSLDISIFGMEGVPASIIQDKMIAKIKKKHQMLEEEIQKKVDLNNMLNPTSIQEMKNNNPFFDTFKEYTSKMEVNAGVHYLTSQPNYPHQYPHFSTIPEIPEIEESKRKIEEKRESKFQAKKAEEEPLPFIMKEEMREQKKKEIQEMEEKTRVTNLNIAESLNIAQKNKKSKSKDKQDVFVFVSKMSPEEKRAKMAKYRYDEKKITSELKNLQMSIQEKLNEIAKKSKAK
jgi:hypothetical protein